MVGNQFKISEKKELNTLETQTVFKQQNPSNAPGTSLGLPENITGALAYLLGFFTGFIILFFEKENRFVRFHAIQSICISLVFLVLFSSLGKLPVVGWMAEVTLSPIGLVLWIIFMLNAYDGKYSKFIYIGNFAEKQFR